MKTNFNKRHEVSSLDLMIQVTSISLVNTDNKGDRASLYRKLFSSCTQNDNLILR